MSGRGHACPDGGPDRRTDGRTNCRADGSPNRRADGSPDCGSYRGSDRHTNGRTNGCPTPSPSPSPANFQGITLKAWTGGGIDVATKMAAANWEAMTGGKIEVTRIPFDVRALKFSGLIATQDGSIDLLYGWEGFVGQFNERLYENLSALNPDLSDFVPKTPVILSAAGGLRAMPMHSEVELFIYNKDYFADAGVTTIPDSWDEMYKLSPALTKGDRYPCATPWLNNVAGTAYWLCYINSIPGSQVLSEDRTQLLFDNDTGLAAFEAVERGFKAKFYDPNIDSTIDDQTSSYIFNQGNAASQINFGSIWSQAVSGNPDYKVTIAPDVPQVAVLPGITPGTSGSINGYEGLGINKFSTNKEAAYDFLLYMSGVDFQKELAIKGDPEGVIPSCRVSVLNDPEVIKAYPISPTIGAQGAFAIGRYGAPYDWVPGFSDPISKLFKGEIDAKAALDLAVKNVNDIIIKYLAG